MAYALQPFRTIELDDRLLEWLIDEHERKTLPRLERLWRYYRNALAEPTDSGGSEAAPEQRAGLPPRLTQTNVVQLNRGRGPEVVIENDIAWRIHALVDFMFPAAPRIVSKADRNRRSDIEAVLNAVFDSNGGIALWQNAALLGSVYGHVDFLINCNELSAISGQQSALPDSRSLNTDRSLSPGAAPSKPLDELIDWISTRVRIETIEAPRAMALLNRDDYRVMEAFIVHVQQPINAVDEESWLTRLSRTLRLASRNVGDVAGRRATITVTTIHSAFTMQRYENGMLVAEEINRLGRLPVVHVQNLAQPLRFEGLSDVEPLIPLQDELNTRISDRANRVTMQSFRMWLGKGIDGFVDRPIGPGQMWATENSDASIESFGGDADSPSERQHLEDLREALDRASGVTPAAAGHIKARVGNLTSENALRISLMGTIAKIKRKRITYGTGMAQLCELILHALDSYGVFRTEPRERQVEIAWADPLPADESRRIEDALRKAQLGVPTNVLRAELGYPDSPTAV